MKTLVAVVAGLVLTINSFAMDLGAVPQNEADWLSFLDAISIVESCGNTNSIVKDVNGKYSYGCLQIQQAYLTDSRLAYSLEDMLVKEKAYEVATACLKRYAVHYKKVTGKDASYEVLARIHNGGPTGWAKSSTDSYVEKLRSVL